MEMAQCLPTRRSHPTIIGQLSHNTALAEKYKPISKTRKYKIGKRRVPTTPKDPLRDHKCECRGGNRYEKGGFGNLTKRQLINR